jgi:hypothetical protein
MTDRYKSCVKPNSPVGGYQRTRDDLSERMFTVTDAVASCDRELGQLRDLLVEQSRAMSREAFAIADLDREPIAA